MDFNMKPFNVSLLSNNRNILRNLTPITTTDIYEGTSKKLNDEGLYSTVIFGRPAEDRRHTNFSYIDIKTDILHPVIYRNLEKVDPLSINIMSGNTYATWNDKLKRFEASDAIDGETGYSFFLKHYKDIKFEQNESKKRAFRIEVLDKLREKGVYDFVLVLPAGIRDIEEDKKGQLTQDEINEYYRSLISLSKNIDIKFKENKFNDGTKLLLQRNFNSIYSLLFSYWEGKRGIFQSKFSKRKLENGTRSVLSPMDLAVEDMRGPQAIGLLHTGIGIHQAAKACLPLVQFAFKHPIIESTFLGDNTANLISPKTNKLERIEIDVKDKELFTTEEGINNLLNILENIDKRNQPVTINGHYVALLYKDAKGFKLFKNIENVPEKWVNSLRPLKWGELLYYLVKPVIKNRPVFYTRYPYNNVDSTNPGWAYIKTTSKGEALKEYDNNFELIDNDDFNEWPVEGQTWIDTLIPHQSRLAATGGDYDGDTGSADFAYTDEAIEEVKKHLDDLDFWFKDGKLRFFGTTTTMEFLLKSMTWQDNKAPPIEGTDYPWDELGELAA